MKGQMRQVKYSVKSPVKVWMIRLHARLSQSVSVQNTVRSQHIQLHGQAGRNTVLAKFSQIYWPLLNYHQVSCWNLSLKLLSILSMLIYLECDRFKANDVWLFSINISIKKQPKFDRVYFWKYYKIITIKSVRRSWKVKSLIWRINRCLGPV